MATLAIGMAGAALGGALAPAGFTLLGMTGAQLGFMTASTAASVLLAPDPPTLEGPRIEDGHVGSSAYGAMIPRLWGTISIAGQVIDVSPMRTSRTVTRSGGKGSAQKSVTYTQWRDFAVLIAEAVDEIVQIYANEQLIYDATPDAAMRSPDWLRWTLYRGTADQPVDGTLEAIHGAGQVPAYRGVAYAVFTDFRITDFRTSAINFRFVATRAAANELRSWVYPQTGPAMHMVHNPFTDLMIGVVSHGITNTGTTNRMLVAIDAYRRAVVYTADIQDADRHGLGSWVANTSFFEPLAFGSDISRHPPNSLVAVQHRESALNPRWRYLRFFFADSGIELGRVRVADSDSEPRFVSIDARALRFLQHAFPSSGPLVAVYLVDIAYSPIDGLQPASLAGLAPPPGWRWDGNSLCMMAARQAGAGQRELACIIAEDLTTGHAGAVFWDSQAGVRLAADLGPVQCRWMEYDAASDAFWMLHETAHCVLTRIASDGTVQTTNWATAFGIAGSGQSIAIDTVDDLLWVVISGVAYAWPLWDASIPPSAWGDGIDVERISLHPGSASLFGTRGNEFVQYKLRGVTGGGISLQAVVEEICDAPGTLLTPADRELTALAPITVQGYRLTRVAQRRAALDVLRMAYQFDLVSRNGVLTAVVRGGELEATLDEHVLGAYVPAQGSERPPRLEVTRSDPKRLPRHVGVAFIDATQNYEAGYESATRLASSVGTEARSDVPVVLTHDEARRLATVLLHAAHVGAERYAFRAAPVCRDTVEPGRMLTLAVSGQSYAARVDSAHWVEAGIIEAEASRYDASVYADFSVGSTTRDRTRSILDLGRVSPLALDLPGLRDADLTAGYYVGALRYAGGWDGAVVYESTDRKDYVDVAVIEHELTHGVLLDPVPAGPTTDLRTAIRLQLMRGNLVSLGETAWQTDPSANVAAIGAPGRWELVRFRDVAEADGVFTVSTLLRGLRDTREAIGTVQRGDRFVLLTAETLRRVPIDQALIGQTRYVKATPLGLDATSAVPYPHAPAGRALRPFRPACLHGVQSGGDWSLSWDRQDRRPAGFLRQPALSESPLAYQVEILDVAGAVVRTASVATSAFVYTAAMQVADFGGAVDFVRWRVAQVSALTGPGATATAAFGRQISDYDALIASRAALIEYWPLGETSGTLAASLSGTRNGSHSVSTMAGQASITADGDRSVRYWHGTGAGYTNISPWAALANVRAVEFVVRFDPTGTVGGDHGIVGVDTSLGAGQGWRVMSTTDNRIKLILYAAAGSTIITGNTPLDNDVTYHVAINFSPAAGSAVQIYVDGALHATGTVANTVTLPTSGIFRFNNSGNGMQARMAKVALYSAALSQLQALEAAAAAKG